MRLILKIYLQEYFCISCIFWPAFYSFIIFFVYLLRSIVFKKIIHFCVNSHQDQLLVGLPGARAHVLTLLHYHQGNESAVLATFLQKCWQPFCKLLATFLQRCWQPFCKLLATFLQWCWKTSCKRVGNHFAKLKNIISNGFCKIKTCSEFPLVYLHFYEIRP